MSLIRVLEKTLSPKLSTYSFQGKSVFITGGSRGLGLSLAWNLLDQGACVALVARDEKELLEAKKILAKDYPPELVSIHICDVTNKSQLEKSFDEAILYHKSMDMVVNNAGEIYVGPFASMEMEDFEKQMSLHLYACIELTKLARQYFATREGGRILNICSLGGKTGVPHMAPYDASKFALAGFAQGVTPELALENIVMTTAFPTVMRTGSPIQAIFKGDHEKEFKLFETIDNLPFLSMSADTAAKKILKAVAAGKAEVVLSIPGKLRVIAGALFPNLMNTVMTLAVGALPKDDSKEAYTGAESTPRRQRTADEKMYNQKPHHIN